MTQDLLTKTPDAALTSTDPNLPTWEALVRREPRLATLRAEVEAVEDHPGCCANAHWYGTGGFRERVSDLVGWTAEREDGVLDTEVAYDVAYDTLYDLLPDCRHEGGC